MVLVDPLPIVTEGLGLFLETQFGVDVVASANGADQALELIEKKRGRTHLTVLVATELGGDHDAFWLMRTLRERFPTILVLACGVNPTRMSVSRALFVGADGFINKRADPAEFIDGRSNGASVEKPDLRTPDIPGAIPSVEPDHGTTDLDVADTAAAEAVPTENTAAKKAPAEKAADETTEDQA